MSGTTNSGSAAARQWHERWYFANDTWVPPASNTAVEILAIAPGGGGMSGHNLDSGSPVDGGDGGNVTVVDSTPTTLLTALGGKGGIMSSTSTQGSQRALQNEKFTFGSTGGFSRHGWPGNGPFGLGAGGQGGSWFKPTGAATDIGPYAGNAGEVKFYKGNVSLTLTITIGAPGAAGTNGQGDGQPGQLGGVHIRWLV